MLNKWGSILKATSKITRHEYIVTKLEEKRHPKWVSFKFIEKWMSLFFYIGNR